MTYGDGWIVETGTSVAHFRRGKGRLCKPSKKLRGIHVSQSRFPVTRCTQCVDLIGDEMNRANMSG